ncbi:MAG: response regulator transcription factor [Actinomycetota bacterium]|nr:response regulator transcription factor [Actinomycetota bacterium]
MARAILIVEADQAAATYLADQLDADGFTPVVTHTAHAARERATDIDAVLLGDLTDPRAQPALLTAIRRGTRPFDARVPILVVSQRAGELDVLRAFEHGADDIPDRTHGYAELRARLLALLRRAQWRTSGGEFLTVGELAVDLRSRTVTLGGRRVELTQREFALLSLLATEPERVFTKAELQKRVWSISEPLHSSRTLDSHACRLRMKLGGDGDRRWVINVWGVGYALTQSHTVAA